MVLLVSLQGCIVTKRKYDDMLAQKVKTEGELADKSDQLTKAQNQLNDLTGKLTKLKNDGYIEAQKMHGRCPHTCSQSEF